MLDGEESQRRIYRVTPAVLCLSTILFVCVDVVAVSFQMVFNVVYPMAPDQRRHVSINSARWLPDPGMGLAYGTNKGDLVICRPV